MPPFLYGFPARLQTGGVRGAVGPAARAPAERPPVPRSRRPLAAPGRLGASAVSVSLLRVLAITATERNWLKAAAIVLGSIALFWALGLAERSLRVAPAARLVGEPVDTSMRILAIPHFLLGFLFLATSRAMRRPRSWIWLVALAALGAALCRLFAKLGAPDARVPQLALLLYFGIHAFRDEAHFFVANGDAPASTVPKQVGRAVLLVPLLLVWLFLAVDALGASFEIGNHRRYTTALFRPLALPLRWSLGVLPLATLAFAACMLRRRVARMPFGTTLRFLRAYRPILLVSGGITLFILVEVLIQGRSRALVTLHVTAWYVFVMYQLRRRPPPVPAPSRLSWAWMRSTPRGFTLLHVGLAALALLGCAVAAYGYRNDASLRWFQLVLSRDAFPYWTIMHITISFVPKP